MPGSSIERGELWPPQAHNGHLQRLNGRMLDEPYVLHKTENLDSYRDNFPSQPKFPQFELGKAMLENNVRNSEIVVPQGSYFTMGDNRDYSLDSRYWGFVPRENIIGKPWILYWSSGSSTPAAAQASGWSSFSRIRWRRILTPIR